MTCPLITKADGSKFGKSEGGNVWLTADKTSVYKFYQFWLNTSDEDSEKYIKIFTFLDKDIVDALIAEHKEAAHLRVLQRRLAEEVTKFVHGDEECNKAIETTAKLFANQNVPAESLSVEDLEGMEGVVKIDFSITKINAGIDAVSFLADTTIFLLPLCWRK